MWDALDPIQRNQCALFVASLQQSDGSFAGDKWNEVDTKFTYCALSALKILDKLNLIDVETAVAYIDTCRNFDEGFGNIPGCESHGGHIFTAVGALSLGLLWTITWTTNCLAGGSVSDNVFARVAYGRPRVL